MISWWDIIIYLCCGYFVQMQLHGLTGKQKRGVIMLGYLSIIGICFVLAFAASCRFYKDHAYKVRRLFRKKKVSLQHEE